MVTLCTSDSTYNRHKADTNQCFNAYLLTVNMPRKETKNTYRIFKVELTDLENGDRGEGLYYMEKEKYYK